MSLFAVALFFAFTGVVLADDDVENTISKIPAEEAPGAKDNEIPEVDEGRRCKRTRKTGSNRITRVCTTRAQREARTAASNEFLKEQQLKQETYMIQNAGEGGVSAN